MKIYAVTLGRLIREETTVYVQAENQEDIEDTIKDLFDTVDWDACRKWELDADWGTERSDTHIIGEIQESDLKPNETIEFSFDYTKNIWKVKE